MVVGQARAGEHGTEQGFPHVEGRLGGGVHSSISSFFARGAPVILRITISNTPLRGLLAVVTFTGAVLGADAKIQLGPWHGFIPWIGHGALGVILICDTVATSSPLVPRGAGHSNLQLIGHSFADVPLAALFFLVSVTALLV